MQDNHFFQLLARQLLQVSETLVDHFLCTHNCVMQNKTSPTAVTCKENIFVIQNISLVVFRLHKHLPPQILFLQNHKEVVVLYKQQHLYFVQKQCIHQLPYKSSFIVSAPVGASVVNPISFIIDIICFSTATKSFTD